MDDLISRQAAIEVADAVWSVTGDVNVAKVWDQIKDLPSAQPEITLESAVDYLHSIGWMQEHDRIMSASAQPERKTGRWIRDEFGSRCGACGLYAYRDKFDRPWESPYCPNCGAKMGV